MNLFDLVRKFSRRSSQVRTTWFDDVSDQEVLDAIRSVPTHYGTTNNFSRFVLPDNLTIDMCFNVGDAISVGDLCYYTASDVARPADQMTTLAVEGLDQGKFAALFCGVSQEQILSTETSGGIAANSPSTKRFTLRTQGVMEFKCPSQTFNKGDLVGVYSNGTTLDPNQVDLVKLRANAIGVVVKYYGSATTLVRAYIQARYNDILANKPRSVGTLAATGSIISDAAAIVTELVKVTGADATKGVILPAGIPGMSITVYNTNASNALKVWPNVGAAINAASANAAYVQTAATGVIFDCYSATQWYSLPLLGS